MTVAEDIVGLTIVSILEGLRCSQRFFFVCALLVVDVFRLDRKVSPTDLLIVLGNYRCNH